MNKILAENYVYLLDGHAYVNLTNRCHNACEFCIRNTGSGVAGTPLWLKKEPTADEVMAAFEAVRGKIGDEVVFCGYGEPTERLDVLTECAQRIKALGYKIRLNTNGLGDLINNKNVAPDLKCFDTVSVSLNECTAEKYLAVTKSAFGLKAFDAVTAFAKECKNEGINVVLTVVDTIGGADVEECKKIAKSINVPLRVREYIPDNYGEVE